MDVKDYRVIAALKHDCRYIHWNQEADSIQVNQDEFNELSEYYQKKGHLVGNKVGCKTVRSVWAKDKSYRFDDDKRNPTLYTSKIVNGMPTYTTYFTYRDAEKANRRKGAGSAGFNRVNKYFAEHFKTTLDAAFGKTIITDGLLNCAKNVKYAIFMDQFFTRKKLKNVYKADISSAWPSAITENIPDLNTAKRMAGVIKPSEEWPVAFYIKSGHIAEFGKYDTHDWSYNKWYSQIVIQAKENAKKENRDFTTFAEVPSNEEITVLCKYSPLDFSGPIQEIYDEKENKVDKKASEWAKSVLNAFIGYLCSTEHNKQHFMPHISAVAYARATFRMISMADELERENNIPIYFAIDSIIWLGGPSKLTSVKKLGAFVSEAEGGFGYIVGHGQYCIEKDGKMLFEKHQGIPEKSYKEKNIKNMSDYITQMSGIEQVRYGYNEKTHMFEEQRRLAL